MMKAEQLYREMLYQLMEKKNNRFTQLGLSKMLNISLSNVNHAIKQLKNMGAVEVKLKYFSAADLKKILYFFASLRNVEKDIIYRTRIDKPVKKIESEMPSGIIYGMYSAYKFKFKDVPADYSEVYVYCSEKELGEIKKRFPENNKIPNLFVLKKDGNMDRYGNTTTSAQTFADLWNLKEWYAKEFLDAISKKLFSV